MKITIIRVYWFLKLVFRPHPYAYPCDSHWQAWTERLVLPKDAWEIAGAVAETYR